MALMRKYIRYKKDIKPRDSFTKRRKKGKNG